MANAIPFRICIMILRKNDWYLKENQSAVIHYTTRNESFLKLARTFQTSGIEHWYCPLALINPALQHIDPHADDLTIEEKAMVVVEMCTNPWYFFREIVRIPQGAGSIVPFKITRATFSLLWCFFNNIDIALLMIRQQGKTVVIASLSIYLARILEDTKMILITKGTDLRSETISKMKLIRDCLPGYCWEDKGDADNSEVFTYKARSNKLLTCVAQNSEEGALNAGRGLTSGILISDETAYTKYIRTMLPAALGAGTTIRKISEAEGKPYGNIFTTTWGKRNTKDGEYVYKLFNDGCYWDDSMLDIPTREELITFIRRQIHPDSDRILIHAPFLHHHIGMTDEELYDAMANAGGSSDEQRREWGGQWTAGGLESPIDPEDLDRISRSKPGKIPYLEIYPNSYGFNWQYKQKDINKKMEIKHIIGLDTSDAIGKDNISLVMVNSETLETAGTAIVNESNLITFANWLADIMIKYENTILIIERKSSAAAIIDAVILKLVAAGIEPTRRLYNTIVQDSSNNDPKLKDFMRSERPRDETFYTTYRKYFGYITTGSSRAALYGEVLRTAVKTSAHLVRDNTLADELLGLIVKNGRIDHGSNGHDDAVISWLLAMWFIFFGKRLEYYGVSNSIALRRLSISDLDNKEDGEEYLRKQEARTELLNEISNIIDIIDSTINPFTRVKAEKLLEVKTSQLDVDTSAAKTLGELKEILSDDKLRRRS